MCLKSLQQELAKQGAPNAQVHCPENIIVKLRTTVTCNVSGASGQASGTVTFAFSDAQGTVDPVHNNAWGVLIQVQQGEGGPPCIGGTLNFNALGILTLPCLFDGFGSAILKNNFANNGSFGHQTNGDIAAFNFEDGHPTSCYRGNTDPAGLTTSPARLEQTHPLCTGAGAPATMNVPLIEEILCGNEGSLVGVSIPCPGGKPYPSATHVVMHPLRRT